MLDREQILKKLKMQIIKHGHIFGVAVGNGMTAKYAAKGGADLILALNSGRFRQMGNSSLAGFLPFANGNDMVMEFGTREIIPAISDIPIIFGLCCNDPTKNLEDYMEEIRDKGFSGINNYPSIGVIDGKLREALEEAGLGSRREADAIRIAHSKNLFTIAFAFDEKQAEQMAAADPDIICVNLGLTKGGEFGAKKVLSLEAGVRLINKIFEISNEFNPETIKMIYGGPITTSIDLQYIYDNTKAAGYIGGSSFDRVPAEESITIRSMQFKTAGSYKEDTLLQKMLDGVKKHYDYVEFVKEYVTENYMKEISFNEISMVAHISRPYLSTLFKKEVGCTFPEYLSKYRINKAIEIIQQESMSLQEIASIVGYHDYAHFSKTFKRITGISPKEYHEQCKCK